MPSGLEEALRRFASEHGFRGKGALSVALVVTEHARTTGLPLDPERLVTSGGGQVLGLGKQAVQVILRRHGIERVLASEGGRTSRGSLGNMRDYVALLNRLNEDGPVGLETVEAFWVERVQEFFAGKPFRIRLDASRSLRTVIGDVIRQAIERQKDAQGTYYAGAVLQHLVGAKLDCALGEGSIAHNSFSTADAPSGRSGDFLIGDVAIHVTTSPTEALIERCRENIDAGERPLIVTLAKGLTVAEVLAENRELGERIDVFEVEQFVALNLYELGGFAAEGRRTAVSNLIARYNDIVKRVETDPSLAIELR